jgi:ABC-type polysaccharide/polyol phosphate export permease
METKGNKLLCNIKIRWISMLNPMKHVLEEYRLLLLKMAIDSAI